VARIVNISPTHLSEKFKRVTGINFVDYVARHRFEKAWELLQNNDLRVTEIAFAVGFQSRFQKICGEISSSLSSRNGKSNLDLNTGWGGPVKIRIQSETQQRPHYRAHSQNKRYS
jgi:hypothetical protein